ncbi:TRAP transporter small permease [Sulfitobacter pacificus]|uniref:TRAP transporter small permease n=1 Tax=Sulfitobacter pacificus TaxID=1499314 RepID=UPI00362098C5
MTRIFQIFQRTAEWFIGLLMGLMFLTFIVQIFVRYSARADVVRQHAPFLDPANFGWTLEFCLLLWVWIVFAGGAFVLKRSDHVTFDLFYDSAKPKARRWLTIIGAVVIIVAFGLAIAPTIDKFHILRLKRTATLSQLFGDWIRVRDVYFVFILFLIAVPLRSAWVALRTLCQRHDIPEQ